MGNVAGPCGSAMEHRRSPALSSPRQVVEVLDMSTPPDDVSEVFEVLRVALAEQAVTLALDEQRVDESLATYLERTATR